MSAPAPIVLFCYNRPASLQKVLNALASNSEASSSDLYIYCDGPKPGADEVTKKTIQSVREIARAEFRFKETIVVERDINIGLANSIIDGVTTICRKAGNVIVVEDDIVVSPYFLRFMNEVLNKYRDDERVISIHGYVYPVNSRLPDNFFLVGADCWGWATWYRAWSLFDPDGASLLNKIEQLHLHRAFNFNGSYDYIRMLKDQIAGKNDSWAIRWQATAFVHQKLTLYPGRSLVMNIGNDGSGVHSVRNKHYDVILSDSPIPVLTIPVEPSKEALEQFEEFFRKSLSGLSLSKRIVNKIRRVITKIIKYK